MFPYEDNFYTYRYKDKFIWKQLRCTLSPTKFNHRLIYLKGNIDLLNSLLCPSDLKKIDNITFFQIMLFSSVNKVTNLLITKMED